MVKGVEGTGLAFLELWLDSIWTKNKQKQPFLYDDSPCQGKISQWKFVCGYVSQ